MGRKPDQPIKRARGRPRKLRTFSDDLRERLKVAIGWCECCDRPTGSIAASAREMRIPNPTVFAFLRERRPLAGRHIDRAVAWLDAKQGSVTEPTGPRGPNRGGSTDA